MADWTLGTVVSIGLRLINHRAEVQAMWTRVENLINVAAEVFPELQALMRKIAPELVSSSAATVSSVPKTPTAQAQAYTVMWLQTSLNHLLPANLKVDGQLGPQTQNAIREYQRTRGLSVDGWAGAVTTATIDAEMRQRR